MAQLRKASSVATEVYINARKLGLTRSQAKGLIKDMTDFRAIRGLIHNPSRKTNSFEDTNSFKSIAQASLASERASTTIGRLDQILRFIDHGAGGGLAVIQGADLIGALTAANGYTPFEDDKQFRRDPHLPPLIGPDAPVADRNWVPVAVDEADVKSRADEAYNLAKNHYINTIRGRNQAITSRK